MILFSPDKEIIFKITNAILLIWFVAAIVVTFSSLINLVMPEPKQDYSYAEYSAANCMFLKEDATLTAAEHEKQCLADFNSYNFYNEKDNGNYYKFLTLYTALANVLIVGGVIYFINKPRNFKKVKR